MRARSALLTLVALLVAGGAMHQELPRLTPSLFAPAYDAVTVSGLRNLAVALQSYALFDELEDVTVTELRGWGWEPSRTGAVTIWVHDDEFRAVARDVRPGAGTFQVSSTGTDGALTVTALEAVPPTPLDEQPAPGVEIVVLGALPEHVP